MQLLYNLLTVLASKCSGLDTTVLFQALCMWIGQKSRLDFDADSRSSFLIYLKHFSVASHIRYIS